MTDYKSQHNGHVSSQTRPSAQGVFEEGHDPLDVLDGEQDLLYDQESGENLEYGTQTMKDVSHTPPYGEPCNL